MLEGCWYFLEDNTIPHFVAIVTKLSDRNGEVRCNALTRRLINHSTESQRLLIGSYGRAAVEAPRPVAVGLDQYASRELRRLLRSLDRATSITRAAGEIAADLDRRDGLRPEDLASLRPRQERLRERVVQLRRDAIDAHRLLQALDRRFAQELADE